MAGILVLGETYDGNIQSSTSELLAAADNINKSTAEVISVVFLGVVPKEAIDNAFAYGADKVYIMDDALLGEEPETDAQLAALEYICKDICPSIVMISKTGAGGDIGPRLAFRLGAGMAQDCASVDINPSTGRVLATRPVYGGNAMATVSFSNDDPQVIVLRLKAYDPLQIDTSRSGEVITLNPNIDPAKIRSKVVETVSAEAKGVRLEDAAIVVSGGRGLGGPEPFDLLDELANLLNGAVGASRAVCDAGWKDHSLQIGLTGKTITPDLYITVGISGASQHMAGCSSAKNIVAINRDADANIFKDASIGVVGDWKNVLPSFIATVRELVKS